jgi:septum formation topological specificity factor MinE
VTRCYGAASAKERLDVVIRDAINAGDIPGPRYLANGQEMARRDGDLVPGITAYADGPDEMRQVIRHHVNIGVDQVKLSMSGEEVSITSSVPSWLNVLMLSRSLKSAQLRIVTFPMRRRRHVSKKHTASVDDYVPMPEHVIPSRCA